MADVNASAQASGSSPGTTRPASPTTSGSAVRSETTTGSPPPSPRGRDPEAFEQRGERENVGPPQLGRQVLVRGVARERDVVAEQLAGLCGVATAGGVHGADHPQHDVLTAVLEQAHCPCDDGEVLARQHVADHRAPSAGPPRSSGVAADQLGEVRVDRERHGGHPLRRRPSDTGRAGPRACTRCRPRRALPGGRRHGPTPDSAGGWPAAATRPPGRPRRTGRGQRRRPAPGRAGPCTAPGPTGSAAGAAAIGRSQAEAAGAAVRQHHDLTCPGQPDPVARPPPPT